MLSDVMENLGSLGGLRSHGKNAENLCGRIFKTQKK